MVVSDKGRGLYALEIFVFVLDKAVFCSLHLQDREWVHTSSLQRESGLRGGGRKKIR